ncbi:hypothetical protein C922_05093 [Plasmodium inui San Antonio 1]|uniref:Uncharacterized protein n=1 Tax=Plasmodium inui San Antonio 1 TaxID=1237626 RepID=W7AGY3_9APIC|nr:hypothetical protein C922_05093 [Plasmodium inui San Antonio 1]EUD64531.1 hypothetical protein C922_05093 [Plasmodium inui San Antonio 1]
MFAEGARNYKVGCTGGRPSGDGMVKEDLMVEEEERTEQGKRQGTTKDISNKEQTKRNQKEEQVGCSRIGSHIKTPGRKIRRRTGKGDRQNGGNGI